MQDHLRAFAPERARAAGDEALAAFVARRMDEAEAFGLTLRGPVRLWLEVSVVLGAAFERDPQYAAVTPDLDAAEWPMPWAQRLHRGVGAYVAACFGEDRAILARVTADALRAELPEGGDAGEFVAALAARLWPEKLAFCGEAALAALGREMAKAAPAAGLESPRGALLAATLGLCFGAGVLDDPLYPFLHDRIRGDAPEEARIARTLEGLKTYAAAASARAAKGG